MEQKLREAVEEITRIYFSSPDISVNLIPSIIIGFLIGAGITRLLQAALLSNSQLASTPPARKREESSPVERFFQQTDQNLYETIGDLHSQVEKLQNSLISLSTPNLHNFNQEVRARAVGLSSVNNLFKTL